MHQKINHNEGQSFLLTMHLNITLPVRHQGYFSKSIDIGVACQKEDGKIHSTTYFYVYKYIGVFICL